MKKVIVRILRLVVAFFALVNVYALGLERQMQNRLVVKAKIVAYYLTPAMSDDSSNTLREQIILLKIDQRLEGNEEAHFVRVHYKFYAMNSWLPVDMFSVDRKWRFLLTREPGCDGPLSGSLQPDNRPEDEGKGGDPILQRTASGRVEPLSTTEFLPCYVLQPGDFGRVIEGNDGIVINGSIVAWSMLYDSAAHPNEAILMVRLNHLIEGQEKAKYIRVQYKYSKWTSNLPMEGFNSKEQWRLLLFRETSCDAPLEMQPSFDGNAEHYDKNPLPVLKRAKNSETAKLPAKESLPCYMLKSGDFSLVK